MGWGTSYARVAGVCWTLLLLALVAPAMAHAAPVVALSHPVGGMSTSDATPPFAGTAGDAAGDDADVSVRVYAGSDTSVAPVRSFTVARAGTAWALAQAAWDAGVAERAPLPDGSYTVVASQAGSDGTGSASRGFVVDTVAPAPVLSGPAAATSDPTPKLTGTAGAASGDDGFVRVRVYAGAVASGPVLKDVNGAVGGSGAFAAAVGLLADGDYVATAAQGDAAGNGATSAPWPFTVAAGVLRIGVVRNVANNNDVYSQRLDGTDVSNLSNDVALDDAPSFSLDGTRMVFVSTRIGGQRDIYARDMATGIITRLTSTATEHEFDPVISPDGTRIAFWRAGAFANRAWVMDADGSDAHIVAQPASGEIANDEHPSWSPDSTRLVLSSRYLTGFNTTYDLTIVDPDDPAGARVNGGAGSTFPGLNSGVDEIEPVWSPDGLSVAFRQVPPGTSGTIGQLHVVDQATHTDRFLSTGSFIADPAWSDDSAHLVFTSTNSLTGNDTIELIDADGTGMSTIPTGSGLPRQPTWQPPPPVNPAPAVTVSDPVGGTSTNDATPPFAGTASAAPGDDDDVAVRVYAGSDTSVSPVRSFSVARLGTAWSVGQSAWDAGVPLRAPLADGHYTVVASQSGPGGTGSASSAFDVDSAAPAAVLTGPSTTADRTPRLTGSGGTAPGDDGSVRVRVYAGSVVAGAPLKDVFAGVGAGGTFSAPVGLLADGDYVATASQGDAAGNGATSAPLPFTVDAGAARIALVRNVASNHDVYSQALDGSGVLNLTNDVSIDEAPSFSLDGTRMVFTSTRNGGQRDIFARNMTTGVVTPLTNTPTEHEFHPVISPDGARIAFWRAGSLANRAWVMDADGSDEHIVAQPASGEIANDEHPSWSPDSTRLVLASRYVTGFNNSYDLTIVDPDDPTGARVNGGAGSTVAGLNFGVDEIEPVWSPDGLHIAFRQVPVGTSGTIGQLHVVDQATHTDRFLATGSFIADPAWSGDSAHLLFTSTNSLTGNDTIELIDADGTGMSTIPTGPGLPRQATWQPLPPANPAPTLSLSFPAGGTATNDTTPPFAGTAGDAAGDAAQVSVRVYAGGDTSASPVRSFTVPRAGTGWALAQAAWDAGVAERAPLPDGGYTVVASQIGTGGTGSASAAFVVDTIAPAPVLSGPASPIADRTPKLTGTGGTAPGDDGSVRVRVYAGSVAGGSPVKDVFAGVGGGAFAAAVGLLADGDYVATASQGDAAGNGATSAPLPFTVDAGAARIAVVRNVANNHDIYTVGLDGGGMLNLTNHVDLDEAPSFSADGSRMLFTSTREGQREIYVRDMATGVETRLTTTPAHEFDPVFSPDGQRIAFWRAGSSFNRAWVMDADGSDEHIVAQPASGEIANDEHPSWSPDSTRLVLASRYITATNNSYDLTIVDPDDPAGARVNGGAGSTFAGLNSGVDEIEPVWSPDGLSIALRQVPVGTSGTVGQLHVVAQATHTDRFLATGSFIADPAWSPDSQHLLFTSTNSSTGNDTIELIDADGTGMSTIPTGPGLPRQATWQPQPPPPVNTAPVVTLAPANDLSVPEGATRTYSYAISDPEGDAIAAVTTGCGTGADKVAGSDAHTDTAGSFQCTFPDGPASTLVSAAATDAEDAEGDADTQTVAVTNVAPTVALSSANDLSVPAGATRTYSYAINDPGDDTIPSVTTGCGANGAKVAGSDTNTASTGSFACAFASVVGTTTVSVAVADSDGADSNTDEQTVALTQHVTTLKYTGEESKQYSDVATLSARLMDGATPLAARTVRFAVGGQTAQATTGADGVVSTTLRIDQAAPASPTVSATFDGDGDGTFAASSDAKPFGVTQEDARAVYTGPLFYATASESSSTAVVTSSATISDITALLSDPAYDASAGDIRNARVTFVNRDAGDAPLCAADLVPALVNASDAKTATVSCSWTANIAGADSQQFTVGIRVGRWYTRDASTENAVVTVSKPLASMITGGGHLVNATSSGRYAGDAGKKTNFGFNVKYDKKQVNLKGSVNTIVRSGGRVYQIKGTAMTSLATQPAASTTSPATARFTGKASIRDITSPRVPIDVDGGATLQLAMTDWGEPGARDTIAIIVWDKSGAVAFSSASNGSTTVEQQLAGGNLVVR